MVFFVNVMLSREMFSDSWFGTGRIICLKIYIFSNKEMELNRLGLSAFPPALVTPPSPSLQDMAHQH